jgi:hypothetical protein
MHGERLVLNLFRALCLLLVASSAFADGPKCTPFGSSASGFKVTLAPTANLSQWSNNAGAYFISSWWCAGKYKPSGWFYIGNRTDLPANWMSELQKVPAASLDALTAAQVQYMTKRLSPESKATGEAQLAATKPALPVWLVAKNGTYPDRPMYRVENGVRATTALKGVRATVAAVCACDQFVLEEGAATFCPLAGTPPELTKVALCKQ